MDISELSALLFYPAQEDFFFLLIKPLLKLINVMNKIFFQKKEKEIIAKNNQK